MRGRCSDGERDHRRSLPTYTLLCVRIQGEISTRISLEAALARALSHLVSSLLSPSSFIFLSTSSLHSYNFLLVRSPAPCTKTQWGLR